MLTIVSGGCFRYRGRHPTQGHFSMWKRGGGGGLMDIPELQPQVQVIFSYLIVFIYFIFLPLIDTGHGTLPQLTGNVSEVLVSSLLQSCYLSSQTLPRVYQHYGPSPIQPLSTEMQILLTVYYLVQLGQCKRSR